MTSPANKRRKLNGNAANGTSAAHTTPTPEDILARATSQEKSAWGGFCEIENDPAFFNVMLEEFGVRGVKVQELYGLDEGLLAMLPQPIHGLIFLYRYRSDSPNLQEPTCPPHIWFANQISDFSCATVSLINIINNIPDIELGPHLSSFKDFTADFPPYLRGEAIANFEFVKGVHNSFAKRMDMLNIDLGLQNQFDDRRKPKGAPAPKPKPKPKQKVNGKAKKGTPKKKGSTTVAEAEDYIDENEDAAFHFSAYVPIDGYVWKLDGLDRQPQRLSPYDVDAGDWVDIVAPMIQEQMTLYSAGDIQFGLMALAKDPLRGLQRELAVNIKGVRKVQEKLGLIGPEWRKLVEGGIGAEADPDAVLDVTEEMLESAEVKKGVGDGNLKQLLQTRGDLVAEQQGLRIQVLEEIQSAADDERKAREARQDYGLVIYTWLKMLAEKEGLMKELVDTYR